MAAQLGTNIPPTHVPVLDQRNAFTQPWRRYFQDLVASGGSVTPAELAAVAAVAEEALLAAQAAQATANEALLLASEDSLSVLTLVSLAELDNAGG